MTKASRAGKHRRVGTGRSGNISATNSAVFMPDMRQLLRTLPHASRPTCQAATRSAAPPPHLMAGCPPASRQRPPPRAAPVDDAAAVPPPAILESVEGIEFVVLLGEKFA